MSVWRINWRNPLARGLVSFVVAEQAPRDQVVAGPGWWSGRAYYSGVSPIEAGRYDTTPRAHWRRATPLTVIASFTPRAPWGATTPYVDVYSAIKIIARYGTTIGWQVYTDGTQVNVDAGGEWPIGKRSVAAMSLDGSTAYLYHQGRRVGSPACTGNLSYDSASYANVSLGYMQGHADYLALYNRVLSDGEHKAIYEDSWQLLDSTSERTYFWLPQIATEQSYSIDVDVGTLTLTGQDITFSNEWLFDEALYPKAVQLTGLTGAYTDIDDNPSSPDGSWLLVA